MIHGTDPLLASGATRIEAAYPLSPMQQGMLFTHLYAEHTGANIEQLIWAVPPPLNVARFYQAWQQVIAHYPILRTRFQWAALSEPLQQVQAQVEFPCEVQDWSNVSTEEQQHRYQNYLQIDRQRGFDLAQAPLMRLAVLKLAQTKYRCIWTFHHILLDGRSIRLLLQQVISIYTALDQGQSFTLAPSPSYQDYIQWLQQQDFSAANSYWRNLLQGFTRPTPLPQASVSAATTGLEKDWLDEGYTGKRCGTQQVVLSAATTSALQELAAAYNVTLNTIVQGAWALLLHHYSEQTASQHPDKPNSVVFGTTRACRYSSIAGAKTMVGLLINTLPVRVFIPPDLPLAQWLQQLRSQHLTVRPYEHTPLTQIRPCSELAPDLPLFESLVVFENCDWNSILGSSHPPFQAGQIHLIEQPSLPLVLQCTLRSPVESELKSELEPELELNICFDVRRFESDPIAQLLERLVHILEQMMLDPEQPLGSLSLLTAAERQQILVNWNATEVDYPRQLRLQDLFEAQVAHSPDAIAVTFADRTLTYAELNQRANQLAHNLQVQGVQPEVPVGICIERSLEMVVGLLAILKAGGAYVPLDPAYPTDRLSHILSDAQVPLILTQTHLATLFVKSGVSCICLDRDWQTIATQPPTNPSSPVLSTNLAYIIYTSGSTGKPKGVLIEHRNAVNTILDINRRFLVNARDRVLAVCSLNFDLSVYDIFGVLAAGGTIVLPPPSIAPDLPTWIELMHREQITLWNSAPPVMQMFAGYLLDHRQLLPACLRLVLLSGDWIPLTLPDLIRRLKLGTAPVELISLGGATEASIWSIFYPIASLAPQWKSIPYGKPLANQKFYILDEQLQPVAIGKIGELYIGGEGVARGYLNRPELNAEKFIADPFSSQFPDQSSDQSKQAESKQAESRRSNALLYRTGDLGRYLPDGTIEFLGRLDHQVKLRGFRVEIGEIEAVLSQHVAVRECAILVREDAPGYQQVVAYLVGDREVLQFPDYRNPSTLLEEIRSLLRKQLPDYMVPSAFVWLEQLPLTPNGKLDRNALPVPDYSALLASTPTSTPITPRDQTEQQLVEIWQSCLKVAPISITANFFELGGNSLLAIPLWAKIEQTFQCNLPLITLFQTPTIAQLAKRLRQPGAYPICPSLVVMQAVAAETSKPPLFCIHTLGRGLKFYRPLMQYLDPAQAIYGLSTQIAGEDFPSNRVEDLALHYVEQMRQIQPEGPYLLLGFSYGGLIAYEMARILEAQGEAVAMLALVDSYWDGALLPSTVFQDVIQARQLWGNGTQYLRHYLLPKIGRIVGGRSQQIQEFLWDTIRRLAIRLLQITRLPFPPDLQDFAFIEENLASKKNYIPQSYGGDMALFKADRQLKKVDEQLGWQHLVQGQIKIYDVPGSHLDLLVEPHVQVLGKMLQDCMTDALDQGCNRAAEPTELEECLQQEPISL